MPPFVSLPTALATLLVALPITFSTQGTISPLPPPLTGRPVHLTVDLRRTEGAYKPIYSWFGYDEANFTTMRDGRKLLGELHDLSPVPVYIRAHHLLTSGDGVAALKWSSTDIYAEDASGRPVYNFKIIDQIFDGYKTAGVRPMVELGFMPQALASGKPPYHLPYPQTVDGSVQSPPKDYDKWRELIRVLTAHLVERYGRETVSNWPFEVWNEPNISYWHGTPQEYWKLYDYAVAGVRSALPEAKVGGPASTGPGEPQAYRFLNDFLTHAESDKSVANGGAIPLDFISFHVKGHPTIIGSHVQMGLSSELNDAEKGFEIVERHTRFRNTPILLSEADPEGCAACSSKENPANNYRNGTLYPAYTAVAYKALFDLQDRYHVNLLAMLSWSFEFEGHDYFEGFRDLSTNGIDKPVLNLFRMLALMEGKRVATTSDGEVSLDDIIGHGVRSTPDVDTLATVGDYKADLLLWNYHDSAEAGPVARSALAIHGLPAGVKRMLVRKYRIDDTHSNAYSVWKAMGSPQHPTTEQYEELKAREGLELLTSPEWLDVQDGTLTLNITLPRQSISLIEVSW